MAFIRKWEFGTRQPATLLCCSNLGTIVIRRTARFCRQGVPLPAIIPWLLLKAPIPMASSRPMRPPIASAGALDVHRHIDHASLGRRLYEVGYCLSRTGQYAEAQPWFERAVAEKEKGDVHGRINHESLSTSLHRIGVCLSSTGRHAEAQPWFERAAAESEKGNVHGRIDHESLKSSLLA